MDGMKAALQLVGQKTLMGRGPCGTGLDTPGLREPSQHQKKPNKPYNIIANIFHTKFGANKVKRGRLDSVKQR